MSLSTPAVGSASDYQYLFQHLPDSYLLLAPDGTVRDNSDIHLASSMQTRANIVGRNIFDAYPGAPESQQALLASHDRVRHTLQPDTMPLLRYDLERPAAQGGGVEERYWQITHHPILGPDGALLHILQQSVDVTEATRATAKVAETQRALDESRTRTHFILESLPLMVWTNAPDGSADWFNLRWLAYTGRSLADTVGSGWGHDLHPDDLENTMARWRQALATGSTFETEYRLRRHDGQYRWFQTIAVPRQGPHGAIQMWVGANADIHQQKLMVAELLETNETQAALADQSYANAEALNQQRATFHQTFEDAPVAIAIMRGPDFRYEFVNKVFVATTGQANLVGHTMAEAFPGALSQSLLATLTEVFRTGQPHTVRQVPVRLEAPGQPPHILYLDHTYQPFFEGGQVAGITSFSYDVTELVVARQAVEQLGRGN